MADFPQLGGEIPPTFGKILNKINDLKVMVPRGGLCISFYFNSLVDFGTQQYLVVTHNFSAGGSHRYG
jgi:hypothetical protein